VLDLLEVPFSTESGIAETDAGSVAAPSAAHRRPWRIAHVIDTLQAGGAEQSLLEITTRMDRQKYEPMVCSVYPGDALCDAFKRGGVRVHQLETTQHYGFARAIRRMCRLLREEQVDLVHTSLFRAGQIGRVAGWITGCPVISSFTNTPYSAARRQWDPAGAGWKHGLLRRFDATTARFVTQFHSVSQAVAEQNCRDLGVSMNRVRVVYRGRDVWRFSGIDSVAVQRVKEELQLTSGPILLNVGRLVAQKGQLQLIELMSRIQERYPSATLLIAGEGPARLELERAIHEKKLTERVRLLGNRSDIPILLAATDLFVFPSYYEGLPGAVVEAMLAGVPVIASQIPMHSEFIDHETNGLLVERDDSRAWQEAVVSLLADPNRGRRLADNAAVRARASFDIDQITRQMEQLFGDVLRQLPCERH
jgi:glycosyltransferase involved in cell wall biosynthesis